MRISSSNKAQLALLRDEVRIFIFDDPAELKTREGVIKKGEETPTRSFDQIRVMVH